MTHARRPVAMMQVVKILVADNLQSPYRAYALIVRSRHNFLTTDELLPHTYIAGELARKAWLSLVLFLRSLERYPGPAQPCR